MKLIGGLAALREKFIEESCVITGKVGTSMTPAIVKLTRDDGLTIERSGMVSSSVKLNKTYAIDGINYKVSSIMRKGVKLIDATHKGVAIPCAIKEGKADDPTETPNLTKLMTIKSMEPGKLDDVRRALRGEAARHINQDALARIMKSRRPAG